MVLCLTRELILLVVLRCGSKVSLDGHEVLPGYDWQCSSAFLSQAICWPISLAILHCWLWSLPAIVLFWRFLLSSF